MDFSRPLVTSENVTTRSKIRYIDIPSRRVENDDDTEEKKKGAGVVDDAATLSLDDQVLMAANEAALSLFQTSNPKHADCRLYPDRTLLHNNSTIKEGDLVVIFESFDQLAFVYVDSKKVFSNRNGVFPHKSFLGMPFGSQIRSRDHEGYGFVYLLKPTPELWARSLPLRTQIIHELDAATIVHYLDLRPNMVVVESGTGSGAMSHALLRVIAPKGKLYTYEFNETRAATAREEFRKNGFDENNSVQVIHRDVCGKEDGTTGGYGRPQASVDAVFLDLPEPWLAVKHAAYCCKPGARLGSYSPCVEQVQKCVAQLKVCGFHSITTMEVRLREYHVDEIQLEGPPMERRKRVLGNPIHDPVRNEAVVQNEKKFAAKEKQEEDEKNLEEAKKATTPPETSETQGRGQAAAAPVLPSMPANKRQKKMLITRPFRNMRGHTAFLTFCTAGNKLQPCPNADRKREGMLVADSATNGEQKDPPIES